MKEVAVDAVSQVLENLQTACGLVRNTVPLLDKCGALTLMRPHIVDVQTKLVEITEITAAVLDAMLHGET